MQEVIHDPFVIVRDGETVKGAREEVHVLISTRICKFIGRDAERDEEELPQSERDKEEKEDEDDGDDGEDPGVVMIVSREPVHPRGGATHGFVEMDN